MTTNNHRNFQVAVIGSGTMGSGIAAHIANAGFPVMLLDIVPKEATDRNQLAKAAIERMVKTPKGSPFTHPSKAALVTPGNVEDDMQKLAACDWIIEAVVEKLDIKQSLYQRIDAVRKPGSVVSSNTSTLPLHLLVKGFPESFRRDFMITHFFNPPRLMPLCELVTTAENDAASVEKIRHFADVHLGKTLVPAKDTPGFIANRIGIYWLMVGLQEALRHGVTVEEADALFSRPLGIPGTGVFGLFDYIGIDLMIYIADALRAYLPESDDFHAATRDLSLLKNRVAEGYTGRKGKGGFYRIQKEGDKTVKEVLDLTTGTYRPQASVAPEALGEKGKAGLTEIYGHGSAGGKFVQAVLNRLFAYTASLVPEIADAPSIVDQAMRQGFAWKQGPFQMMDALGLSTLTVGLQGQGIAIPALLQAAQNKGGFYVDKGDSVLKADGSGYASIPLPPDVWLLEPNSRGKAPVYENASVKLWDMGEGIACLQLTTKMHALDHTSFDGILASLEKVKNEFRGMVIGSDDAVFSAGFNLNIVTEAATQSDWEVVSTIIKNGQKVMQALKYAPFPIVSAGCGIALGGGCELLLHSSAVQAHVEGNFGLVEVNVGLIPGWGGCVEMMRRHPDAQARAEAFANLVAARTSTSADDARTMGILNEQSHITMNRDRLLHDAKTLCLSLAEGYLPATPASMRFDAEHVGAIQNKADSLLAGAAPHQQTLIKHLAFVFTAGRAFAQEVAVTPLPMETALEEASLYALEYNVFMQLVKMPESVARIQHMLAKGKPLMN
jgi:3-hydroxyacyl-CoA dehydrogenase